MKKIILCTLLVLTFVTPTTFAQSNWNPDAGLNIALTANATVTASSETAGFGAERVLDGDDQTQWISDPEACYPNGFFESNLFTGRDETAATDGDISTSIDMAANTPYTLTLSRHESHEFVGVRYSATAPVELLLGRQEQSDPFNITATLEPATNHTEQVGTGVYLTFEQLTLQSAEPFQLFEVAGVFDCVQHVTVDLGSVQQITSITTRHWSGGQARSSSLWTSETGVGNTWNYIDSLNPDELQAKTHTVSNPTYARYIRLKQSIKKEDYAKVYVWEISAEGNPSPDPAINPNTLSEMFGVNGIWGWGHDEYSDLHEPGEGADLYNRVASHARNYHNLNWDVLDPDNDPNFGNMAADGTNAFWWLDWDREYQEWVNSGMELIVSVQFTAAEFPPDTWDDPYQTAYDYGVAFATHFGETNGNGSVSAVEIGNEPWDYTAAFYSQILDGMSAGIKSVEPEMRVLPAAFQADSYDVPSDMWRNNYLGSRLTEQIAPNIDALNQHTYSWRTWDGGRIAVHPEHQDSTFHAIRNMVHWRDANMPDTPIYVTEWGWDSAGAGESCDFSECVSEYEQAVYGVRGLLIMARYGIERATWFFYANHNDSDGVFSRSGLTGSDATNFAPKQAFTTFETLFDKIGDRHFIDVIREDTVYIYELGEADGTVTHLVAWNAVAGEAAWQQTDISLLSYEDRAIDTFYAVGGETEIADWDEVRVLADPLIIALEPEAQSQIPLSVEGGAIKASSSIVPTHWLILVYTLLTTTFTCFLMRQSSRK